MDTNEIQILFDFLFETTLILAYPSNELQIVSRFNTDLSNMLYSF